MDSDTLLSCGFPYPLDAPDLVLCTSARALTYRTVNPLDGKVNNKLDDKKYIFFNKFSSNLQRITMPRGDTLQARHSW